MFCTVLARVYHKNWAKGNASVRTVQPYTFLNTGQKIFFLHFELNYFTGVNRLTPLANFPHSFKSEEKDIPHSVTKSFM